jgi:LPXTG-motif cell wall-anchored protein
LPTTGESPIADYMAAALLAFGVASALYRRERTRRGGRVDTRCCWPRSRCRTI